MRDLGFTFFSSCGLTTNFATFSYTACARLDDDVFYLFLQKQKIGAELHIYLEEGTYHKRPPVVWHVMSSHGAQQVDD